MEVNQVVVPQVKITGTKPDPAIENSSASDKSCSFGCGAKTSDLDGPGGPSESHHQVGIRSLRPVSLLL